VTTVVQTSPRPITALFVAAAMTFPLAMALVYFAAMGGTGKASRAQQATYAAGKVIQFSLPVLFFALVAQRWPARDRPSAGGLLLGVGFGLLVGAAILGAYFGWLRSSPLLAQAPARIRGKMEEFGVASPAAFLALAAFLSIAHSFLEEYYWRWFVFGQLRTLVPVAPAIVLSSLGFMAHHVVIVWAYLPLLGVVLASIGIAMGGAAWAWLYHRAGSLVAPWVSHAIIDLAIFVIGWDVLRST
jgi:membrane protease YdiL (CAAX protease family)